MIDVEHTQGVIAADLVKYFTSLERPVKVVTILDDDDWVLAAQIIRAGADAVMTNDDAVNNLIAAVLTVAQGHAWVVPRILGGVLREFRVVATTTERIRSSTRAVDRTRARGAAADGLGIGPRDHRP